MVKVFAIIDRESHAHMYIHLFQCSSNSKARAQTPPSHEERGLVTIERLLGCAESEVLVLNNPMK